jgi:transcriptional regulator with XRE-family HTH domain
MAQGVIKFMRTEPKSLRASIRALRDALQETQEGMARRLGMTLSGYVRWERGERRPRGAALKALLDLCPDEATRGLFALDPARRTKRARAPSARQQLHSALDLILDRAPPEVRDSVVEAISQAAGKCGE